MVEGTRSNQPALAESVANLRVDSANNKEFQASVREFQNQVQNTFSRYDAMFTSINTQLSSLATSYDSLSGAHGSHNIGDTSGDSRSHRVPFAERWGIQARTLKLDFPRFDGTEPNDWVIKAEWFFSYGHTLEEEKVPIASFHM
jgi:uncharacterized lipoprotein YmbA